MRKQRKHTSQYFLHFSLPDGVACPLPVCNAALPIGNISALVLPISLAMQVPLPSTTNASGNVMMAIFSLLRDLSAEDLRVVQSEIADRLAAAAAAAISPSTQPHTRRAQQHHAQQSAYRPSAPLQPAPPPQPATSAPGMPPPQAPPQRVLPDHRSMHSISPAGEHTTPEGANNGNGTAHVYVAAGASGSSNASSSVCGDIAGDGDNASQHSSYSACSSATSSSSRSSRGHNRPRTGGYLPGQRAGAGSEGSRPSEEDSGTLPTSSHFQPAHPHTSQGDRIA